MTTRVSIRLRYTARSRLIVPASFAAILVASLACLMVRTAGASPSRRIPAGSHVAASTAVRKYYLTTSHYNGSDADGAGVCATGYHFASIWEILDPSNLGYDIGLGQSRADSGHGPPSGAGGWVRTGYNADTSNVIGVGNCGLWQSHSSEEYGTLTALPSDWPASSTRVHVWVAATEACDVALPVWCVSDALPISTFLPLVLRN